MRYTSAVEVNNALGLPERRHLRKEHVLQLMSMLSDMDSRVALNILGQLPDIAMFARVAMDDVAKGHDATLSSNARGIEMVHEVHMARLELLKGELSKDVSPEERLYLVSEVREGPCRRTGKGHGEQAVLVGAVRQAPHGRARRRSGSCRRRLHGGQGPVAAAPSRVLT